MRFKRRQSFSMFALGSLLFSSLTSAEVWEIPSDSPGLIQAVIDTLAKNGDTIQLEAGAYHLRAPVNTRGLSITVRGVIGKDEERGTTISALEAGQAFDISSAESADCVIRDLNIECGVGLLFDVYETGSANNRVGGGILMSEGASPSILNCRFSGGSVEFGGGIYVSRSSPLISDCVFESNYAYFRGGAIYHVRSNGVVAGCVFLGNSSGRDGGAIRNKLASILVEDCQFFGSETGDDGAAIANEYGAFSEVVDSVFQENIAGDVGGAIFSSSSSSASVQGSLICKNSNPSIYGSWIDLGENSIDGLCDRCDADFNDDGNIDSADLGILLASWGERSEILDLDMSGLVGGSDLGLLFAAWGPCR